MPSQTFQEKSQEFQKTILAYYKTYQRDLPWRNTTDPYKILVSELMLQQTQVDRVLPKYEAFIAAFPTPATLHKAPLHKVLILWQGLGYNRRAQYLWQAASLFMQYPKPAYEQLVDIKGVGEYTAAAVCAFSYNQDVAAIDVNVRRVFNRFFGPVSDDFIKKNVPLRKGRNWHNALMDFGSQVCTKKNSRCDACPLKQHCHALANNTFSSETSTTQKKFLGSVRWHRGQLLKTVLERPVSFEEYWRALDKKHRNYDHAQAAAKQLVSEKLVSLYGSQFRAPSHQRGDDSGKESKQQS